MDKNQNGFTLIEILVTLAILSIGLLGMAALTVEIIRSNAQSKAYTEATILAQDRLEEVKRISKYTTAVAETEDIDTLNSGQRETTVFDDSPEAGMKEVVVTVSWDSIGGRSHSVALKTILAE